jgi:phage terminase large subunit-like protein
MKSFFICCGLLLCLFGCTPSVSQTGVNAITEFYGGGVNAKVGISSSTDSTARQGRYVELELRNNNLGQTYSDLSIPASNCAYLFYHNISEQEKQKYTFIKSTLNIQDVTFSQTYSIKELAAVEASQSQFDEIRQWIKSGEYDKLLGRIERKNIPAAAIEQIKTILADFDKQHGRTITYELVGFKFVEHPQDKHKLLSLLGIVRKERTTGQINVTIDPAASISDAYIVGMYLN